MSPDLFRRPPAYWAAPLVRFLIHSPCADKRPPGAAMVFVSRPSGDVVHVGTNWTDGTITVRTAFGNRTYHINGRAPAE